MKFKTKDIVIQSLIAALYFVISSFIQPLNYGDLQFRFAEILCLLPWYDRKNIIGLCVGCFIVNLWSPYGIYDLAFGTLGSLLAGLFTSYTKNRFISAIWPAVFAFIYAIEAVILTDTPLNFFAVTISIMIPEFIIVGIISNAIFTLLEQNNTFRKVVLNNKKSEFLFKHKTV